MSALVATKASPSPRAALRASTGRRGVPATVLVRATRLADLLDECHAAGQEMVNAGRRVEYAVHAGRSDLALHTAGRLQLLGQRYRAVR